MRFYDSLGYLNNNNNNNNNSNNYNNLNGNVSSGNTVKTFTSNGNNQTNHNFTTTTTTTTATTKLTAFDEQYFAPLYHDQNAPDKIEFDLCAALSTINDENCIYGLNRKLKSRENLNELSGDSGIDAVDNDINSNECGSNSAIDEINFDESSSDVEAEINQLINRGNLYRRDFVENLLDNNFMDDDEGLFFFVCNLYILIWKLKINYLFLDFQKNYHQILQVKRH